MRPFDDIDRLANNPALDKVAAPARDLVHKVLRRQDVKDALHGVWMGHPLHPMLAQLSLGSFVSAGVLDVAPHPQARDRPHRARRVSAPSAAGWADYADGRGAAARAGPTPPRTGRRYAASPRSSPRAGVPHSPWASAPRRWRSARGSGRAHGLSPGDGRQPRRGLPGPAADPDMRDGRRWFTRYGRALAPPVTSAGSSCVAGRDPRPRRPLRAASAPLHEGRITNGDGPASSSAPGTAASSGSTTGCSVGTARPPPRSRRRTRVRDGVSSSRSPARRPGELIGSPEAAGERRQVAHPRRTPSGGRACPALPQRGDRRARVRAEIRHPPPGRRSRRPRPAAPPGSTSA